MSQFLDRTMRPRTRLALLFAGVAATALLFPVSSQASVKQEAKLTAAAGSAEAKFGISVSISGDTAVVGAPDQGGASGEASMGAAYVFTRSDGAWTEQTTLVAPVRSAGDKFGFNVAVDGDTVVVGAPNADELRPRPGAAYVFSRSGDTWAHQATLTPPDRKPDDLFGFDVAVSGDTVVVGAHGGNVAPSVDPGAAYVFTRTGDVWVVQAKLAAREGGPDDDFGYSVGVSGDTAVVSAINDDVGAGIDHGSISVFTRAGSSWTEQATLAAADGSPRDAFGESVAIAGDLLVVGASFDDVGLNPKQGSAYVFARDGGSWSQQAKLTAPDGAAADLFGRSVAAASNKVVVGAHFDEPDGEPPGANKGSVYVYTGTAGVWSEPTRLTAADSALHGVSVGVSGDTVIGGAGFTKVGENANQGAAYVYRLGPPRRPVGADGADSGGSGRDGAQRRRSPAVTLPETR